MPEAVAAAAAPRRRPPPVAMCGIPVADIVDVFCRALELSALN